MVVLLFAVFVLFVIAGLWAWRGICLYKYLRYVGYERPVYGWIPFLSSYAVAVTLADEDGFVHVAGLTVDQSLFGAWWVVAGVGTIIPYAGVFMACVLSVVCLYVIYKHMFGVVNDGKASKLLAFASVFVPIIPLIVLTVFKPVTSTNTVVRAEDDSVLDIE